MFHYFNNRIVEFFIAGIFPLYFIFNYNPYNSFLTYTEPDADFLRRYDKQQDDPKNPSFEYR